MFIIIKAVYFADPEVTLLRCLFLFFGSNRFAVKKTELPEEEETNNHKILLLSLIFFISHFTTFRRRKFMNKKIFALAVLFSIASLVLSACGGTTADGGKGPLKELGAGEGQVDIIAWAGYIENGSTDPAYDWVTAFEAETGCKVNVKVAATSDEMVSLMNQGGFDLVTASGDASNRLIAGGKVQEINLDLIPSWDTVDDRLKEAPWHTVDGKHYGTPYQWGPNVLMYNTNVFPEAPTSWSVVFVEQNLPDGQPNTGRVQAYDGPIYVADAALYLKFNNPELGIKDPYALTREQFDAAIALLRDQRPLVSRYWHDAFVQMDDFKNEGVVVSGSWPFQVNLLQLENQPIASTIPQEGATGWADTTMMHVDAPHPNCAYMWMEHSLDPKVQGDVAAWFGSNPAVPAGCTASELLGATGCEVNGFNNFDKIAFWRTPTSDCGDGTQNCVAYNDWVTSYIAVIGGQ
jgi:putative spermidine/putrescine transport system substrate-binding protein